MVADKKSFKNRLIAQIYFKQNRRQFQAGLTFKAAFSCSGQHQVESLVLSWWWSSGGSRSPPGTCRCPWRTWRRCRWWRWWCRRVSCRTGQPASLGPSWTPGFLGWRWVEADDAAEVLGQLVGPGQPWWSRDTWKNIAQWIIRCHSIMPFSDMRFFPPNRRSELIYIPAGNISWWQNLLSRSTSSASGKFGSIRRKHDDRRQPISQLKPTRYGRLKCFSFKWKSLTGFKERRQMIRVSWQNG